METLKRDIQFKKTKQNGSTSTRRLLPKGRLIFQHQWKVYNQNLPVKDEANYKGQIYFHNMYFKWKWLSWSDEYLNWNESTSNPQWQAALFGFKFNGESLFLTTGKVPYATKFNFETWKDQAHNHIILIAYGTN